MFFKNGIWKEAQKIGERRWIRRRRSLIGPKPENRKTRIGTKIYHKNPQKLNFCSVQMVHSKGGIASNSWGGTETNSWKAKTWYQN